MSPIVKICGMTNPSDALVAVEAGADALGFVFYDRSPRCVTLEVASEIARALPAAVLKVGVFVDPSPEQVMTASRLCALDLLQFHGTEEPDFCLRFGVRSMKAFRVKDAESLANLQNYRTDAWLLDAYSAGALGGTGQKFNWDLAIQAREFGRPIFLAGGLTPENVREAVATVRPYGVDVSSGVELSPGRKDPDKVRRFIAEAKRGEVR